MKYWIYMDGEVPGSFTAAELAALPGFNETALVCPAEGEILEKNWRRAGEFSDIFQAKQEKERKTAPDAPPTAPAAGQPRKENEIDRLIDSSSNQLFKHVTNLMKELENRREERALNLSLQRQIVDLKEQLQKSRELTAALESRVSAIPELEEAQRNAQSQIQALEAARQAGEAAVTQLRVKLEKAKMDLKEAQSRVEETTSDLSIRNRLVDKLSHDLTEKELSLAKSLSIIRRLEEDLGRICKDTTSGIAAEVPHPEDNVKEEPKQDAHNALQKFTKKFLSRNSPYDH